VSTLAITGATGHLGRLVAHAVRDLDPRLVVRDPSRLTGFADAPVAAAEYGDLGAGIAALVGVDVLFMVSAAETPDRRREHRTFVEAAARAGVGHVVYTSFCGAAPDATFTLARDHHDTEEALRASGLEHTILRDNLYLDLVPHLGGDDGVIRGPAGDGRIAAVARADVAAVAAEVLRAPGEHAGRTYDLTGSEALTLAELASRASVVTGRTLRFEDETVEDAYASRRAAYDVEDWQLDAWVSTYTAVRDGSFARLSDDVRAITGRRPLTIERVLLDPPS
jgi:uncharacterized protein YbjT (DUF2867 family)